MLSEMIRVTKPGGIIAAREGDLDTEVFWPPIPGVLKFHEECVTGLSLGNMWLTSIASKSS